MQLQGYRSHGEPFDEETITIPRQTDPSTPGGVGVNSADASVVSWGTDNFSNDGTAWDVVANRGELSCELGDFLKEIRENAEFRSCAALRTMDRLRDQLDRIPEDSALGLEVKISLMDAALLARMILSRLR
jgi:hypothetical protein